jgi:amino acid transporter
MLLAWAYLLSAAIVPMIEAEASVTYLSNAFPASDSFPPQHDLVVAQGHHVGLRLHASLLRDQLRRNRLLSEVNRWVVLWKRRCTDIP